MFKAPRIAFASLIFVACVIAAPAAENKKPNVKLKTITLNRVDWSNQVVEAAVSIEIDNPGAEFKVKDVSYRLKLNGQAAAHGKHKNEVKVPAFSIVTIELPITVNISALPAITWRAAALGFKVIYELDAEFTVPVFAFFSHKVKTAFSGELTLGSLTSSLKQN